MKALLQMIVVVLVAGLLTVSAFGLHMASFLWKEFQEARVRSEELQRLQQATDRRIEARLQTTQAYIDQSCTFAETMRRYRELDQELYRELGSTTDFVRRLREQQEANEEEGRYQILLIYLECILGRRPEKMAAVRRRLEKDYQQWRDGRRTSFRAAISEPRPAGRQE